MYHPADLLGGLPAGGGKGALGGEAPPVDGRHPPGGPGGDGEALAAGADRRPPGRTLQRHLPQHPAPGEREIRLVVGAGPGDGAGRPSGGGDALQRRHRRHAGTAEADGAQRAGRAHGPLQPLQAGGDARRTLPGAAQLRRPVPGPQRSQGGQRQFRPQHGGPDDLPGGGEPAGPGAHRRHPLPLRRRRIPDHLGGRGPG